MRNLRVAHAIGNLKLGGAEAILVRLIEGTPEVEHHILTFGEGEDYFVSQLEALGVRLHYVGGSVLGGPLRIRRALAKSQADVVQGWMYHANLAVGAVARTMRLPVAWSVHNASMEGLGVSTRAWIYAGGVAAPLTADHVIMCSGASERMHRPLGYGRAALEIVRNGYDTDRFRPDAERRRGARARLDLDPQCFLIGSVTRWHQQKDPQNLIQGLARLNRQDHPNWKAILVGRGLGPDNRELTSLVEQEDLSDRLLLLGERNDVPDLMRAMDVHAISSRGEAFPNVVAEAMASGTPNLVTNVGDAAFMVGDTGWVVPPREPDRIADALRDAIAEWRLRPTEWEARRERARSKVRNEFGFAAMVGAYRRIWSDLATRGRTLGPVEPGHDGRTA